MESKLVEDLKKLQVFTAYDFFKMDELVHDLTNALEESTRSKGKNKNIDSSRKTKKRSKKRKSHINPMVAWELGNMSEASESSLDEAIKDYMENIAQQSDSDDLLAAARCLPSLSAIVSNPVVSLAESDSVNENFSPIRPHRRKRRFKRMAVDPQNASDMLKVCTEPGWPYSIRNPARSLACDDIMPSCSGTSSLCTPDIKLGKRKRSMRDKTSSNSLDVESIIDDGSILNGDDPEGSSQNMDSNCVSESGTSSMSSNESDGLHTNDEARDGDDEQSDFYHEPGPACGIPGIVPWWEASKSPHSSPSTDPSFESILRGSFEHMSKTARRNFQTRLKAMTQSGRPYRSGRRRLKDMKSMYSLGCFLQERQQWNEHFKKPPTILSAPGGSSSNGKSYDPKRRRKTPPLPSDQAVEAVGGGAEPIADSNIGNRILQSMGWTPGSGLGADGQGMTTPVQAYRRPWRQGLGTSATTSTSAANS